MKARDFPARLIIAIAISALYFLSSLSSSTLAMSTMLALNLHTEMSALKS